MPNKSFKRTKEITYEPDDDRKLFLETLGNVCERFNWVCHAYLFDATGKSCQDMNLELVTFNDSKFKAYPYPYFSDKERN